MRTAFPVAWRAGLRLMAAMTALPLAAPGNSPHRSSVVSVPAVAWADSGTPPVFGMNCPNCDSRAPKPQLLSVGWETPDHPPRRTHVLRCTDCTCCFYDDQNPPDYAEPSLLERGRVPFYLQQGAGISLITSPLARVLKPPGSAYLEVGCGFGFGLDFAVNARSWNGKGIDPAPLSDLGRRLLGLDIELRYLETGDANRFRCDVVMSSETVEHVPSPIGFVRTLASVLKPDGVLILTTPDAEALSPATPPGALVPLLSPGLHLVFQNENSLRALLTRAGLRHVIVERDSYSLVAYASRAAFALRDQMEIRGLYRAYLEQRARSISSQGDLFLAFAGRALQESVNDGELDGARRAWALLDPVCQARFGLDLDRFALPDAARTCSLETMATLMPLNLAGLLYSRAMLRLMEGESREAIEPQFLAGAAAAVTLRRALNEIAIDDMLTEQLGWICRAEACLCAAARGGADVLDRLRFLTPAPGGQTGPEKRRTIVLRGLVELVNAGHYRLACELAEAEHVQEAPLAVAASETGAIEAERDAIFALAILDLQEPANPARGKERFARVQRLLQLGAHRPVPPLFWAALRGEMLAVTALAGPEEADRLRDAAIENLRPPLSSIPEDLRPVEARAG